MAEEPQTLTQPAPQPAAPPVPEDYERLKAIAEQYEQVAPVIQAIAPRWDDLRPLLEDEEEFNFYKTARQSRQQYLESQKPKLTPELEAVRDEFKSELTPIVEYVQSERKQKEDAAKASEEAAQQANLAYAQRLMAERPDLAEENYWGMHSLAALAQRDSVSLEDAWKRYSSRFAGAAPKRETPPPSLRSGDAAPGVPGPSHEPRIRSAKDITRRLAANLRAGGMRG